MLQGRAWRYDHQILLTLISLKEKNPFSGGGGCSFYAVMWTGLWRWGKGKGTPLYKKKEMRVLDMRLRLKRRKITFPLSRRNMNKHKQTGIFFLVKAPSREMKMLSETKI